MIYSCPKQALLEVHLIFINEVPLICWISVFFFFFLKNDPNSWLLKVNRNFILLFLIQKHFTKNVTCSLQMYIFKICQSQFFTSSSSPLQLAIRPIQGRVPNSSKVSTDIVSFQEQPSEVPVAPVA